MNKAQQDVSVVKVDYDEVYNRWLNECQVNGLTMEVLLDVASVYLRNHPEEMLKAMDESMQDWDF